MLIFRKASIDDLETLVKARKIFLRTLRSFDENTEDWKVREENIREYHRKALADDSVIAYLVYDGDRLAAFGEACLYDVIPGFVNYNGKRAYIMNIYTDPDYRNRGIGMYVLHLLVTGCRERGVNQIQLNASKLGQPLYENYGFTSMTPENMILGPDGGLKEVPLPEIS